MIVAQRGLGDFWSSAFTAVGGFVGSMFGSKAQQQPVLPPECMSFDAAGQSQCMQMYAAVRGGQMSSAQYSQWVSDQSTSQTIKKYALPVGLGVGALVLVTVLLKRRGGSEK